MTRINLQKLFPWRKRLRSTSICRSKAHHRAWIRVSWIAFSRVIKRLPKSIRISSIPIHQRLSWISDSLFRARVSQKVTALKFRIKWEESRLLVACKQTFMTILPLSSQIQHRHSRNHMVLWSTQVPSVFHPRILITHAFSIILKTLRRTWKAHLIFWVIAVNSLCLTSSIKN